MTPNHMRLRKMWIEAQDLDHEQTEAGVYEMFKDPRAACLLRLLHDVQDDFSSNATTPKMAPHHGELAHAMGGAYAMECVLGRLEAIMQTYDKREL